MSKLVNQIATLRAALRSADVEDPDSFSRVFHAFFDISDGPDLIDACDPVDDPIIRTMIEATAREHTHDRTLVLTSFPVLHHRSTGLFHGSCFADGFVGTFFYFAEDQQGLVAFNDGSPMTHYYRISATVLPRGTMPMRAPAGRQ